MQNEECKGDACEGCAWCEPLETDDDSWLESEPEDVQ